MFEYQAEIKMMAANADIAGLIKALGNQDDKVQIAAVKALSTIGQPAVYALFEAMMDTSENVRIGAASALCRIGGEGVTRGLMGIIKRTDSMEAVSALERIADKTSVHPLISVLGYKRDCKLCLAATNALGNIGPEALDAVPYLIDKLNCVGCCSKGASDYFSQVNERAASALGKIGSGAAISALIKELEICSKEALVWEIADALGDNGTERAIIALAEELSSESFDHRLAAATILKFTNANARLAVPYLINVLNDAESDISEDVAEALGNIGDEAALPALTYALHNEDDCVVAAAHYAIAKITGTPGDHIKALCDMMFTENDQLSWEAAELLGDVAECASEAVPSLIELALGDYHSSWAAVQALGRIGDTAAVPALKKVLKTRYTGMNEDLHRAAKVALENIYRKKIAS